MLWWKNSAGTSDAGVRGVHISRIVLIHRRILLLFIYLFVTLCFRVCVFHSCFHLFFQCHEINVPYFPSMPTNKATQHHFEWKLNISQPHTHRTDCVKQTHAQTPWEKAEIIRTNNTLKSNEEEIISTANCIKNALLHCFILSVKLRAESLQFEWLKLYYDVHKLQCVRVMSNEHSFEKS